MSEANLDLVGKYFGSLGNLFGTSGNHEYSRWKWDEPETYTEAYKDICRARLREVFPYDVTFASRVVNGVNFVSINCAHGFFNAGEAYFQGLALSSDFDDHPVPTLLDPAKSTDRRYAISDPKETEQERRYRKGWREQPPQEEDGRERPEIRNGTWYMGGVQNIL